MTQSDLFKPPSDVEFNDALRSHTESAYNFLKRNRQDDFIPELVLYESKRNEQGQIQREMTVMLLADFSEYIDRRYEMMEAIGLKMGEQGKLVTMLFFQSEVWISDQANTPQAQRLKASEQPNRREAIIVAGLTADGRKNIGVVHYKRSRSQKIVPTGMDVFSLGSGELVGLETRLCSYFYRGLQRGLTYTLLMRQGRNN